MQRIFAIALAVFFLLVGGLYFVISTVVGYFCDSKTKSLVISFGLGTALFALSYFTRENGLFGVIQLSAHDGVTLGNNNSLLLNAIHGLIWTFAGNTFGRGRPDANKKS